MRTITLAYGKTTIPIRIPSGVKTRILRIPFLPAIRDLRNGFNRVLGKPLKTKPFDRIFHSRDRVAIVIPDKTRRGYFVPITELLIKRLNGLGIANRQITIVIARGLHSGHSPQELKELVGQNIYETIQVIDHDAKDLKQLAYLGKTSFGTPVWLNRVVVEADRRIICSTVQYHYFAGFSGGRKMISPGVAGAETIKINHQLVFNRDKPGKNPRVRVANLADNPLHLDMLEAARMRGVDFSINLVLNHRRQIARIFAGDLVASHEPACQLVDRTYAIPLAEPADFIIASTGGYPSDFNFIQSHKTLEHAVQGLRPGGHLLALAECPEGIGSTTFLPWFKYQSPEEIESVLRNEFVIHGHTALCTLLKAQRFKIYFYTHLKPAQVKTMHLTPVRNIQQTINWILQAESRPSSVLVITEGFSLLPRVLTGT